MDRDQHFLAVATEAINEAAAGLKADNDRAEQRERIRLLAELAAFKECPNCPVLGCAEDGCWIAKEEQENREWPMSRRERMGWMRARDEGVD